MRFTRYLALALSLFVLCATLAGCSGDESGKQKTGGEAAPAETVAHVQRAIDAADLLTSADVAVFPGEGVVACSDKADDFLPMYSMYDLKKLSISKSGSTALALTKNNELYFKT